MEIPKIDGKLTLLTDFGETEAICAEVLDDPTTDGVLLKVMVRGPFEQGQQCWIAIAMAQKSARPWKTFSSRRSTAK